MVEVVEVDDDFDEGGSTVVEVEVVPRRRVRSSAACIDAATLAPTRALASVLVLNAARAARPPPASTATTTRITTSERISPSRGRRILVTGQYIIRGSR